MPLTGIVFICNSVCSRCRATRGCDRQRSCRKTCACGAPDRTR
ncbi:hypothetical protein C4K35_2522 [Pseudomonas chlororaphis subsp. piscium]|nr:hypothetical protein C4K35_2522 [Pseudomonas chlororaphis subsp. piscium]AZC56682.1 hypothetical protein C4K34_2517 [Pseudomonas chlororaphis subsp. piscium]AZC62899.1 hypothetical protein C4K33_2407 [Pseudomonas chlororaphis subsp. piscium]AZC69135.1 hypothetical protein C4K32_2473 [Pseudomonas chlororaphis subsp. piscium]AZC75318.1 hypothetical protein C4K31_2415 [Pseudomonas chlororaphis subsp. piscium]